MIEKTIGEIEAQINRTATATPEQKRELLQSLATLKAEICELAKTHEAQADSIQGFARVSAHEATRPDPQPQLLELSLHGLRSSVTGFEHSHPRLVQIVNSISNTLANIGI